MAPTAAAMGFDLAVINTGQDGVFVAVTEENPSLGKDDLL